MSTKIFNGFIINKKVPSYELIKMLNIMREEVNGLYEEILVKDFIKFVSKILDNKYCMNKREYNLYLKKELKCTEEDVIYRIFKNEVDKCINSEERIYSDYDYSCSMTVHPLKNKTLLMLFSQKSEYKKIFGEWDKEGEVFTKNKFDFIDEYTYYNNTDKPKNVSNSAWEQRSKDWDNALGYKAPSEVGMIVEFVNAKDLNENILFLNLKKELENIYDERIKRIAKKYVNKKYNIKIIKELGKESDIHSYIRLYEKMIRAPKYQKDIITAEKRFRKILPLSYDVRSYDKLNKAVPILKEEG